MNFNETEAFLTQMSCLSVVGDHYPVNDYTIDVLWV